MSFADALASPGLRSTAWSVAVHDVAGGEPVFAHAAERLLDTASVAKVFVLIELADALTRGDLHPELLLSRARVPRVGDSGLWQHLAVEELPLVDVARLVGALSDNWATNVLIDLLGLPAIQEVARAWAPGGSMLHDRVRDRRTPCDAPTLSRGSAADWVRVLARLHRDASAGDTAGRLVLDWLGIGLDLSMVASAFELDPLAHDLPDQGVVVRNKTGTDDGVRADIGLVATAAGTWAYAAICNWDPARDPDVRASVLSAMRALGTDLSAVRGQSGSPALPG